MEILPTLFGIAVLGLWLFALIESTAIWLFVPFLFRMGVKVKTEQGIEVNLDRFKIGIEYATEHAKFIRISKNSCLFCHRYFFFQLHTPFPVKGEILQSDSGLLQIWKVPLSSSLFLTLLLIGGLISGILSLSHLDIATGFSAIGASIGIALIFIMISVQIEGERARTALSEIKTLSETSEPRLNTSALFYKLNLLEKSSENFSREIAKTQLQNGEHIIKTFIGQKRVSPQKQSASFSANWYCLALTQSMLLLIELDSRQHPSSVKRIPLFQVISADFEKGWLHTDKISLNFGSDGILNLNVKHSLRNQTQALCSVF